MSWVIRKQARDQSDEVGKVEGERFDHKDDAVYLAALLEEHSGTHRFWAEEEIDYEYAVQVIYGRTPRNIDRWYGKGAAMDKLKLQGHSGIDPTWGTWISKLVKRRKAGSIEDA